MSGVTATLISGMGGSLDMSALASSSPEDAKTEPETGAASLNVAPVLPLCIMTDEGTSIPSVARRPTLTGLSVMTGLPAGSSR